jgi:hypothetical protein
MRPEFDQLNRNDQDAPEKGRNAVINKNRNWPGVGRADWVRQIESLDGCGIARAVKA